MRLTSITNKYAGTIEVFDSAVDPTAALRVLKSAAQWDDARIGVNEGEVNTAFRNNSVAFFDPLDFRCSDILRDFAKRVWHYLNDYAIRYDVSFSALESVNVNRYEPGQRYKAHADDGTGHTRVISALVYMNDVVEGGETEFVYHGISVAPKAGRLIIFPSNYAYAHAAHPPISGVKYSAAFWTVK